MTFYVQNTDAAKPAHLTMDFYDTEGNLTCENTDTLSSLVSKGCWLPGIACLGPSWVGGAVVTSDADIVAVGRPNLGASITAYDG